VRIARASRASITDALSSASACQSRHARRRAAQRNLTTDAVEYIMTWGRVIYRTGAGFYFLARKDIPAQHRHLPWVMRLDGAVALVSRGGEVITLYRDADALRLIQRKLKYRITPGSEIIGAGVAEEEEDGKNEEDEVVDIDADCQERRG
jgi:hypothetical protein